jgi:hypothetical protein
MNKELIEYYWNEITECGEFVYESPTGFEIATKPQPLKVETPTKEKYWGELLWYLNTQGAL